MAQSLPSIKPGPNWIDIFAQPGFDNLTSTQVTVQGVANSRIFVYCGGTSPPARIWDGMLATDNWAFYLDNANIWIRSDNGGTAGLLQEEV